MDNGIYSTSDLWLAAYLRTTGMRIIRIEGGVRKAVFIFADTGNREELIKDFYNDAQVGITAIKNAMADLKSAIFNMA